MKSNSYFRSKLRYLVLAFSIEIYPSLPHYSSVYTSIHGSSSIINTYKPNIEYCPLKTSCQQTSPQTPAPVSSRTSLPPKAAPNTAQNGTISGPKVFFPGIKAVLIQHSLTSSPPLLPNLHLPKVPRILEVEIFSLLQGVRGG